MSKETEFVSGLIAKAPNENAPEYVKARLSIKREELIAWLQTKDGDWINADVKVSTGGKWYVAVDSWKPKQGGGASDAPREKARSPSTNPSDFADDDIPFDGGF